MPLEEWKCSACEKPMLVLEGTEEDVCPNCHTLIRRNGLPPKEADASAPVATPLADRCPYCRTRLPATAPRVRCPRCGRMLS
ncbi:MAG: hypothetical protein HY331_14845 [Chloroflexi bacterium]|nr:hypothetical protein [Chloroflexota bacterium]